MKILYLGQRGIPVLSGKRAENREDLTERRVQALTSKLACKGHEVTVTCSSPYVSKNLRKFNGVRLRHHFSPGSKSNVGWTHSILSLGTLLRVKPAVVHISGWKMAALSPVAVILNPESSYVWTIDSIPNWSNFILRRIARLGVKLFDAITVPERELQCKLLHELGVRAIYIPDGYEKAEVPLMHLRHLGLRTSGYNVVTAGTAKDLRVVAKAYKEAKIRKKLVVLADEMGAFKRVARDFKFLQFVGLQEGRPLVSLLEEAKIVILTGEQIPLDIILKVMDAGKAIVATTEVKYHETLGVSAQYVKPRDVAGMAGVLKMLHKSPQRMGIWGRKAAKRAQAHFTWERLLADYMELYHYPYTKAVPVDSVMQRLNDQYPMTNTQ